LRRFAPRVNFLLHHHLARRDLGAGEAAVGAMLPDLWRMADRRVRARPERAQGGEDRALGAVLAGIDHHLVADRWFHKDPVFFEGEQRAVARLRAAGIEAPRMGLFAHVLWELCLDGELVKRTGLERLLASLREGFERARGGPADRAAEIHHWSGSARTAEDRALFDGRMGRLFTELARGPWIEGYQYGEGVAIRIEGVRSRLGLAPMSAEDRGRLGDVASALLGEAEGAVDRVLAASFAPPPRDSAARPL
jgi:hypothetical protein